ncbi:heavy metal-associated isoprenylated plant protein 41-like protein [Cinnamomum micranthum f. kanehirae]|uniref:Heavy metal-associated isoprenylated plant protein 41-like protein n=1 Tax=Cinnamomum micranthum f. kanehirae TaxID=337451 RepID=A0A3S3MXX9_9MAGN|nr:heavy metal-associated isoprenylated plant protein 41-like protein [Cinnamomum micranthum f. kanehirae]
MMIRTSAKRRGKCPRPKQQKMMEDDTTHRFIMYENHHLFFQEDEEEEEEEEEEGKWVKHYSSLHEILLVGEGDFSFSLCLANAFGSASNIVTTSLDDYDVVTKKYSQAKSNIQNLLKMGATVLHGVDATKMKLHTDLSMRKFDRIIFNFPHAGFRGKEHAIHLIRSHRSLVQGFFRNASPMLRPYGEVHVSHKTSAPYDRWNLEELASKFYLTLTECVSFEKADYPGYNNKRGDGARCDEAFLVGECSTFKFRVNTRKEKTASEANAFYPCGQSLMDITETQHNIPLGQTLEENQFGGSISFDGNDHLICYPRMNNTSSMQLMYGTPHENTRLFSRSNHSRSVRYQPEDRTIGLPVIPESRHENLRHSQGNDCSLGDHLMGVTSALPVMWHFTNADTNDFSFDGNDRLFCYPRTNNPSSTRFMFGTLYENARVFSRSNHSRNVGYQPLDHATTLPVIPGGGHGNLRHSEGNHYSLSARYQGVTNALQVMRCFNHADTINISDEWEGRDYDFLSREI